MMQSDASRSHTRPQAAEKKPKPTEKKKPSFAADLDDDDDIEISAAPKKKPAGKKAEGAADKKSKPV